MGAMMKLRMFPKLHSSSGQGLLELAMVLPILVMIFLAIFDLSRAIRANNIIVNMSREGANLALRTSRDSISSEEIMNSLAITAQPLSMSAHGMMCITEVKMVGGTLTIPAQEPWSKNSSGATSRVNGNGSNLNQYLGGAEGIQFSEGESRYVFEVGYTYTSLFFPSFTQQLHSVTVF
jgi:Flp pilus assembly protein TadG